VVVVAMTGRRRTMGMSWPAGKRPAVKDSKGRDSLLADGGCMGIRRDQQDQGDAITGSKTGRRP
jgi:hypothetical protein